MDMETLLNHSLLAEAAYANLWNDRLNQVITADDDVKNALVTAGFSQTQAEEFIKHWEVIDHQPDTNSGFSATLFKNKQTDDYVFANRGTAGFFSDILSADFFGIVLEGMATHQLIDMYRYFRKLETPEGLAVAYTQDELDFIGGLADLHNLDVLQLLDGSSPDIGLGAISSATTVTVTGHSLGGHLSTWFPAFFGSRAEHTYTYNGAGIGGFLTEFMDRMNQIIFNAGMLSIPNGSVTNTYAEQGLEVTAGIGVYIGEMESVFIENQDFVDVIGNHSIKHLTDSLAVYQLINAISPSLGIDQITYILEASSNVAKASLEGVVNALGNLLGAGTEVGFESRDGLHARLLAINSALFVDLYTEVPELKPQYQNLHITETNNLASSLTSNDTNGLAYRYALINLSPFAIAGSASLYTPHNTSGELNYDSDSEQFWRDRADFLNLIIQRNTEDLPSTDIIPIPSGESILYTDVATSTFVRTGDAEVPRIFKFGSEDADPALAGGSNDDRLYGRGGNDTINGNAGRDHLEGNNGNDTLYGDAGIDSLYGGAGDDHLYGGTGTDFLDGGDDNDTYYYNTGDGKDRIHDSEGNNSLIINSHLITEITQVAPNSRLYTDSWENTYFLSESGELVITVGDSTQDQITIGYFDESDHNFGISLTPVESTPPPVDMDSTVLGDLTPMDQNPSEDGIQMSYDEWGNVIVDPDTPEPNRDDVIRDRLGNEVVRTLGGDDVVYLIRGGDNLVETGDGDDLVSGFDSLNPGLESEGNDTVAGGAGSDRLFAGAGNDVVFAHEVLSLEDAFALNETQTGTGLRGDFLQGYLGDDTLVGHDGNDALFGDAGADVILGGGGADIIMSDYRAELVAEDWSASMVFVVHQDGSTSYQAETTGIDYLEPVPDEDAGDDVIFGGTGDDFIMAGAGNDIIDGGADHDQIAAQAGDDRVWGGSGNDTLWGDVADDLYDVVGNDTLDGGVGDDHLYGDGGSDVLYGGEGNDYLDGDSQSVSAHLHGNDDLYGGAGNDILVGRGGDDFLDGGDGADALSGGEGDDRLYGNQGADELQGGAGQDHLEGGAGTDTLWGEADDDVLQGGLDDDVLYGGEGNDALLGGGGNDQLRGELGDDTLDGMEGDDTLRGGDGADQLVGGTGSDQLYGGAQNDRLDGGADDDFIWGDEGNDILTGGAGVDYLAGGEGDDTYRFSAGDTVRGSDNSADTIDDVQGWNRLTVTDRSSTAGVVLRGLDATEDAYIDFGNASSIYIQGGMRGAISEIELADGRTLSWAQFKGQTFVGPVRQVGTREFGSLEGGASDDTLVVNVSSFDLSGGRGNDTLIGLNGNHTYHFSPGDGVDHIYDVYAPEKPNRVRFGEGIAASDLSASFEGDALVIRVGLAGDALYIHGMNHDRALEQPIISLFEFSDNTSLTLEGLFTSSVSLAGTADADTLEGSFLNETMVGEAGDDVLQGRGGSDSLFGGDGDDVMDGGLGDDWLHGAAGRDTYLVYTGSGHDMIVENDMGERNSLKFVGVRSIDELVARIDGDDLIIELRGGNDGVRIIGGASSALQWDILGADDNLLGTPADVASQSSTSADIESLRQRWLADSRAFIENDWLQDNWSPQGDGVYRSESSSPYGISVSTLAVDAASVQSDALIVDRGIFTELEGVYDYSSVSEPISLQMNSDMDIASEEANYYWGILSAIWNDPNAWTTSGMLNLPGSSSVSREIFASQMLNYATMAAEQSNPGTVQMANTNLQQSRSQTTMTERFAIITGGDASQTFYTFGGGTVDAGGGDDVIIARSGGTNYGSASPGQFLNGGAGNDTILGTYVADWLLGGDGNNILVGSEGHDTYYIDPAWNGHQLIDEVLIGMLPVLVNEEGGTSVQEQYVGDGGRYSTDTLRFGSGLHLGMLEIGSGIFDATSHLTTNWGDAVVPTLEFSGWGTGSVTLLMPTDATDYPGEGSGVEYIEFASGSRFSIMSDAEVEAIERGESELASVGAPRLRLGTTADDSITLGVGGEAVAGLEGNDQLSGSAGTDTLLGGAGDDQLAGGQGNDWLNGGAGNDIYVFRSGDGQDTIYNQDSLLNSIDTLIFGSDITPEDLWFSRMGTSLIITLVGTADQVRIHDWYAGAHYQLDSIQADGATLDRASVDNLVAAMSVHTVPGEGQAVSPSVQLQLQPVLNANWVGLNTSPEVNQGIADQVIAEDAAFSFTIPTQAFFDQDGDALTFSVDSLPGWLSFDGTTFSGTPANSDVGSATISLTASDAEASVSTDFQLTVTNTNDAPIVAITLLHQSVVEGDLLAVAVPEGSFTDQDAGDSLHYSASLADGSPLPVWLDFDPITRLFSGTPGAGDVGLLTLRVIATDLFGASVASSFSVTVTARDSYDFTLDGTSSGNTLTGTAGRDWIDGRAGNDTIYGLNGNDTLIGGLGNDTLYGGEGDDEFRVEGTGQGSDRFYGDGGDDVIVGGAGNDTFVLTRFDLASSIERIEGGDGSNILAGTSSSNVLDFSATQLSGIAYIDGGAGNDTITGSAGDDRIIGGTGNDTLQGGDGDDEFVIEGVGQGSDTVLGGAGFDSILGGDGDDIFMLARFDQDSSIERIVGGDGLNILMGTSSSNVLDFTNIELSGIAHIDGGAGNDTIIGSTGNDRIIGGAGNDTLYGDEGDDEFVVEGVAQGADTIWGGDGFDAILGGADDDTIMLARFDQASSIELTDGGAGTNVLTGTASNNVLDFTSTTLMGIAHIDGGAGNDLITGSTGADVLLGSAGADTLRGGAGDDQLTGGIGNDTLDGGPGSDLYCFAPGMGADLIQNVDADAASLDIARFEGVAVEDLWFSRSSNHLVLTLAGTVDRVTVSNWYASPDNQLDRIEVGSLHLLNSQVDQLVSAMSAFAVPSGAGNVIPQTTKDQLQPVLAATWQAA